MNSNHMPGCGVGRGRRKKRYGREEERGSSPREMEGEDMLESGSHGAVLGKYE